MIKTNLLTYARLKPSASYFSNPIIPRSRSSQSTFQYEINGDGLLRVLYPKNQKFGVVNNNKVRMERHKE